MQFTMITRSTDIRRLCQQPTDDPAESVLLTVEETLFHHRVLGPVDVLARRAVHQMMEWVAVEERSDMAVVERFGESCEKQVMEFSISAGEALDEECGSFTAACARCFGLSEADVPSLVNQFHTMENAGRLGVFLAIEESRPFRYLTKHIDAASGGHEVDNPDQALRRLLKLVQSGEG